MLEMKLFYAIAVFIALIFQCCGMCLFPRRWEVGASEIKPVSQKEAPNYKNGGVDPLTKREVAIDLPEDRHIRNTTHPRTGSGCCVFASLDMASDWHNFLPMRGVLQDRLGGGWPAFVTKTFARRAPGFSDFVQAEGSKTEDVIDWAFRTGRMPCVTYGYGPRYGGKINHMVVLLHLDPPGTPNARACVLDNNFPKTWEWMSRDEFFKRHRTRGAWVMCYLLPPPPPSPLN